ncbi:protein FAM83G [Pholidichthys leucotaenia]
MALSQIQCLDDHHVNWRVSEGKPEFFYSEGQRLALEALIDDGRDAFTDYMQKHDVREFLSEQELERIEHAAEPYRPGHEQHHQRPGTPLTPVAGNATPLPGDEADDGAVSLEYWPDRSEFSVAELDLGWPDAISYRGVTRATVHTQPPTDGYTHIKEVVRKSIAGAQKVIAVVMDVFTDVDIFRDLLDAGYKRKVPVYIILDVAAVPGFLSMCGRADMHRGHLKHLRVRCCGGVEFFTRSAQKVRGSLSQKFLLVDGDRAISGSYSFTWSSSRLDRNLITVITGQAVETFDFQFRDLYLLSRGVSLSKVSMVDEPIRDPVPQVAPTPVPASVARKLINPKYALVTTGTHTSPDSSNQNSSHKNSTSQNPLGLKLMKGRLKEVIEEPPIHPGLINLEKANLIPYLPTWPEPDPPSDVIGFINIRDEKRAHQVHLQRSERFEVSQAIRFSSPLSLKPEAVKPALGAGTKTTGTDDNPPTAKQLKPQTDQTVLPQQADTPPAHDAHKPSTDTSASPTEVTADSQPTDNPSQTPQPQMAAPPVPKRRTLQIVIDPAPLEQAGEMQVTLVKIDQVESLEDSFEKRRTKKELVQSRGRLTSRNEEQDSDSNGNESQYSTKVMCDRAVNYEPSSNSTASEEEFFDCSQPEANNPLANGVMSGSGRGHHQGEGLNVMARLSQSMLDLRQPSQSEDSTALIRESQMLRKQEHLSPHRNIRQMFQTSKSPPRDPRMRPPKVIIAKPGSFHRPARAAAPVIGGHRYWQGQMLQPDSGKLRAETRSGRSPRRHSPNYRKTDHTSLQPEANQPGLLGVSFSKFPSFRNLRPRGGASQKKVPQNNNKPAR